MNLSKASPRIYAYEYPRPSVTVDAVVFHLNDNLPQEILLIKRANEPFKGSWALPGGYINLDEELESACARELFEETGVKLQTSDLKQVGAFGAVHRDPRGRTIMVAFTASINKEAFSLEAGDDAHQAAWHPLDGLPLLAFDHQEVIDKALMMVS